MKALCQNPPRRGGFIKHKRMRARTVTDDSGKKGKPTSDKRKAPLEGSLAERLKQQQETRDQKQEIKPVVFARKSDKVQTIAQIKEKKKRELEATDKKETSSTLIIQGVEKNKDFHSTPNIRKLVAKTAERFLRALLYKTKDHNKGIGPLKAYSDDPEEIKRRMFLLIKEFTEAGLKCTTSETSNAEVSYKFAIYGLDSAAAVEYLLQLREVRPLFLKKEMSPAQKLIMKDIANKLPRLGKLKVIECYDKNGERYFEISGMKPVHEKNDIHGRPAVLKRLITNFTINELTFVDIKDEDADLKLGANKTKKGIRTVFTISVEKQRKAPFQLLISGIKNKEVQQFIMEKIPNYPINQETNQKIKIKITDEENGIILISDINTQEDAQKIIKQLGFNVAYKIIDTRINTSPNGTAADEPSTHPTFQ